MNIRIFDIETDNLLDKVTKLHCFSYIDLQTKEIETTNNPIRIRELIKDDVIWCGHNIVRYDFPVLEKLLDIKTPEFVIDTLALSWYLYPERNKHGLEEWGQDLGTDKPKISDWSNLTYEEYVERCEKDCEINLKLWNKMLKFLNSIYQNDNTLIEFLKYFHFKLDCVRVQESHGLKLDVELCSRMLKQLEEEKDSKNNQLEKAMPSVAVKKKKIYRNAVVDKNGNLFTKGDLFYNNIEEPKKESITLEKIVDWNEPNSNSHKQIKDWLYSLGWVPENIKHVRDKETNEVSLIPQIASAKGGGEICNSIKKLFEKEPKLEVLDGLSVLSHRLSIFKGFLKDQKDGVLYASMSGLTNTLRLQHKTIVNLPAISKKYGTEIRSCIIAREGCILLGSDLANIEDRTKRHYIYKYDPKYVEEMNVPGYDAHLQIGLLANMLIQEDIDFYKDIDSRKEKGYKPSKEESIRFNILKTIRNKAKVLNFSATYKVGAEALARNSGSTLKEAKKLLKIYWEKNKAILDVENSLEIRYVGETRWIKNPINNFWYSLRSDKDKFSTLNQGSAVYVFDMYIKYLRSYGLVINMQYHDEILSEVLLENIGITKEIVNKSIEKVNQELKLNVPIGCSQEWGYNYANVH